MPTDTVPSFFRQGRKFRTLIFLILALLAPATLPAQNLLTNGDFELNDRHTYPSYQGPPVDLAYVPIGQPLPGWTFSHSVDLYGPINAPQNGSQFLDLVGGGPLSATYSISQTFATVAGYTYHLDFFYGNNENFSDPLQNPGGVPASFNAALTGSGTILSVNLTHSGDTMTVRNWGEFAVNFVANSSSTTLTFTNLFNLPANFDPTYTVAGATLDNVIVSFVVPEPGGWPMAIAVSVIFLGALLTSRRQSARQD